MDRDTGASRKSGALGEVRAEQLLRDKEYDILAHNYVAPGAEIDLIARDGAVIVFVEVKTRTKSGASGREAVTREKQRRICRAAVRFLAQRGWQERFCRFDVIEICPPDELRYIERAFEAG